MAFDQHRTLHMSLSACLSERAIVAAEDDSLAPVQDALSGLLSGAAVGIATGLAYFALHALFVWICSF